jgi:polyisoprenoid-binding protein YceI
MTTLFALPLLALTLQADPAHSTAGFAVKHMMVTTVRGQFDKFTATIDYNEQDPSKSKVNVNIDTASVDTHNEKRDAHLKSAEFFDAQKCPQITFTSSKVEKQGDNKYKVTGDLNMHCVSKPVTLDVSFTDKPVKSPFGTNVYSAEATGKIKRTDWGLNWNKTLESGGVLVSDDVDLDLNLELAAPQPKEAASQAKGESKSAAKKETK